MRQDLSPAIVVLTLRVRTTVRTVNRAPAGKSVHHFIREQIHDGVMPGRQVREEPVEFVARGGGVADQRVAAAVVVHGRPPDERVPTREPCPGPRSEPITATVWLPWVLPQRSLSRQGRGTSSRAVPVERWRSSGDP